MRNNMKMKGVNNMVYAVLIILGFAIELAYDVAIFNRLNRKIDELDEALFKYMKDEHNAKVEP